MSRHRPELKRTLPREPPRHFLLVAPAVSPLGHGEEAATAAGLARALTAAGHRVTVFTLVPPALASVTPWLARRLRTVPMDEPPGTQLSVLEGRAIATGAEVVALAAAETERARIAVLLRDGALALAEDGLLRADVVLACGESAALAAAELEAPARFLLLPDGRIGAPLTPDELRLAGLDVQTGLTLAGTAAPRMQAVFAPGAAAAAEAQRILGTPVLPLRPGSDEPPNDPTSDPALPATYSAGKLSGKTECRRTLARSLSLALGPRTLLLATAPLEHATGGDVVLATLPRLATLDVVVLLPGRGDADLLERARIIAVEHPGRLVVVKQESEALDRLVIAAADALLFSDVDDHSGRLAGQAQLYGVLPIAPDRAAYHDQLVDIEPASATGTAVLFSPSESFEVESAIRRAIALRVSASWPEVVAHVMHSAPRWSRTAGAILQLCHAEDETEEQRITE